MAIVRVYGTINGHDYLPFLNQGDRYYFPIPETLTGKYICEFWAEDDYGNAGYNAAILTLVRGVIKCIEVLDKLYQVTMRGDPLRVDIRMTEYKVKMEEMPMLAVIPDAMMVTALPITCRYNMREASV